MPDDTFITDFGPVEQQAALDQAKVAKIPLVSWHAGPVIGPDAKPGIFANVATDPMKVSAAAAKWAFADAGGKPGVVSFTDSTYATAIARADKIKATIEALGGTVLEYVDTPSADTSNRMPTLTTALVQKQGPGGPLRWRLTVATRTASIRAMATAAPIPRSGARGKVTG